MLNKYKHISFDLDGTLIHTLPEYRYSLVPQVVNELKGKIKSQADIDKFWFEVNRSKTIEDCFGVQANLFWELFLKLDTTEQRSLHTKIYDDVIKTFTRLKEAGKIISIVTGAPNLIAKIELAKISANYDFDFSIRDSEYKEKPAPESLHFVLKKLNCKPEETIYIGNGDEDAKYAKNAGVDFIRINRSEYNYDFGNNITTIHSLNELF